MTPLLPTGFYDLLPDQAVRLSRVTGIVLSTLEDSGFTKVDPPLLEFEDTLLPAIGGNRKETTFRFRDTDSPHMLALRSDITPQIARIARHRLKQRPLKLCYAGPIVRMEGAPRQMQQIGGEQFGDISASTIAGMMILAVTALNKAGLKRDSLIIECGVAGLLNTLGLSAATQEGLARRAPAPDLADTLTRALFATAYSPALHADLPLADLPDVLNTLQETLPVSLNLADTSGFPYQTGVCFALYHAAHNGPLAKGGCYTVAGERACGFSVYANPLLEVIP